MIWKVNKLTEMVVLITEMIIVMIIIIMVIAIMDNYNNNDYNCNNKIINNIYKSFDSNDNDKSYS